MTASLQLGRNADGINVLKTMNKMGSVRVAMEFGEETLPVGKDLQEIGRFGSAIVEENQSGDKTEDPG